MLSTIKISGTDVQKEGKLTLGLITGRKILFTIISRQSKKLVLTNLEFML